MFLDEFRRFEEEQEITGEEGSKRSLSAQLAQQMKEFERNGGKVQEIPTGKGSSSLPTQMPNGTRSSGMAGVSWSTDKGEWSVRTRCNQYKIGFAPDLATAEKMQTNYEKRKSRKKSK